MAVDDFGTGYSSLRYLAQFPVDLLKVDRSFVAKLGIDEGSTAIVSVVVQLAKTLGIEALAEGVERPIQLEELRSIGCHYAQGFAIAPPMPISALPTYIRDRREPDVAHS